MAARPPQDTTTEPDAIEFGIAALDPRLERANISFPADAGTIVEAVSDIDVPYDPSGNEMALDDAIARTGTTRFESERQLLNELHPVFEAQRESRSGGVLARLRSLFPF